MWLDQRCQTCNHKLREKREQYQCTSVGWRSFYRVYCPKGCPNHGGK